MQTTTGIEATVADIMNTDSSAAVTLGYKNWLCLCFLELPLTTRIDVSRPALVSIGSNVDMNTYFQILTHDWASFVFRNKYHDFVNSSGRVEIGSNIYIGTNVIVLRGVTIGRYHVLQHCQHL